MTDEKEVVARTMKSVEQDYANVAAHLGDMIFKGIMQLQRLVQEADLLRAQQAEESQAKKVAEAMMAPKEAEIHTA